MSGRTYLLHSLRSNCTHSYELKVFILFLEFLKCGFIWGFLEDLNGNIQNMFRITTGYLLLE